MRKEREIGGEKNRISEDALCGDIVEVIISHAPE
jgi:hypothetical protein